VNIFERAEQAMHEIEARVAAREKVPGRQRPDYQRLHMQLVSGLRPKGGVEMMLADRVVDAAWALRQAEAVEAGMFELGEGNPVMKAVLQQGGVEIDPRVLAFASQADEINKAAKYVATRERLFQTALTALYREQARRGAGPLAKRQ